jgi:2-amino-4-hydroxy-6-hydroxymethyldihydropteridine diphosphokinase
LNTVFLLLGSNEGDRQNWLRLAIAELNAHCGSVVEQSHIYETAAWGIENQPAFFNQAVLLHSPLSAPDLLLGVQRIEQLAGRQRTLKWGQRTLDIDILFYNDEVINLPQLQLPHPFIQERRFALAPLAEIAPNLMHPTLHKTMTELLEACRDPLKVKML